MNTEENIVKITVTATHSVLDLLKYVEYLCYVGRGREDRKGHVIHGRHANEHGLGRNFVYGLLDSRQYGQWKTWLQKQGSDQLVDIKEETLRDKEIYE